MKRLLLLACLLGLPLSGWAQSAVPNFISYQGTVSDSAGALIAAGTVLNKTVIFRIYDAGTGGTRLFAESQTVTIADGAFSVLIGAGTPITVPATETNTGTLDAIFNGTTRFLGVTVDDDGNLETVSPEISPRQQLVTTPFAFRAKVADTVLNSAISTAMIANNAVTSIQLADSSVTTAKLPDAAVATAKLADNAITSAKIADLSIGTADIGAAQVTAAKLGADVGLWSVNGANINRASNVGIHTTTPNAPLSLGGTVGNTKLAVFDDGTSLFGLGVQTGQFRFHVPSSANRFAFLSAPAGTEVFTVTGTGNVGIGTSTPGYPLNFGDTLSNTKLSLYGSGASAYGLGVQNQQFRLHVDTATARFSFLNAQAGAEVFTVTGAGKVGINVASPIATLDMNSGATSTSLGLRTSATGTAFNDGLLLGYDSTGAWLWNYEASPLRFTTSNAVRQFIAADGRMGFNTENGDPSIAYLVRNTASAYILWLQDRNGAQNFVFAEGGNALKIGGGSWSVLSDRRLKQNVDNLGGSLDQLLRLRSVTFDYKDEKNGKGRQTGFIAQEVQEIFPQWVSTGPDNFLNVGFTGFEAQTVQALRELRAEKDAQIAALAARVRELESTRVTRAEFTALEKRLNAFHAASGAGNQ